MVRVYFALKVMITTSNYIEVGIQYVTTGNYIEVGFQYVTQLEPGNLFFFA